MSLVSGLFTEARIKQGMQSPQFGRITPISNRLFLNNANIFFLNSDKFIHVFPKTEYNYKIINHHGATKFFVAGTPLIKPLSYSIFMNGKK